MTLKKGVILILGANIVNMLFNLLISFLLPKYLTIDAYAEIKSFQLYVSYIGVLHLGYVDGMYLKYGGKSIVKIPGKDLQNDILTMRLFQAAVVLLVIIIGLIIGDNILIATAFAIFPINISNYYRNLLQATGEFERYARTLSFTVIITFAANFGLLLLHIYSKSEYYIILYVAIDIVVWIFLEIILFKDYNVHIPLLKFSFTLKNFVSNIRGGILLMLGNASSMVLTGMDRWFIKLLMDNVCFAQYSFVVSIEGLLNVAITPISITLYSYFCSNKSMNDVIRLRKRIVLFASGIIASAFPARFIIEMFLQQYMKSIPVVFLLFAGQMYYIVVKCIYVNLYKAQKKQGIYFKKLIGVLGFGFAVNAGLYYICPVKESFAFGTLFSGIMWLVLSVRDFKELKFGWHTFGYMAAETIVFLFAGFKFEAIIGSFVYFVFTIFIAILLMKQDFIELLQIIFFTFKKLLLKETK